MAQIARESIKTTLELPGPLSGPWTPAESEFGSALVMCIPARNILRRLPPKMKILDPPLGSDAPGARKNVIIHVNLSRNLWGKRQDIPLNLGQQVLSYVL